MTKETILYRGAEAEIIVSKYLDFEVIEKRRVKKKYRIKEIDERLISARTKEEAKLICESRKNGVSVPIVYDVDIVKGIIRMQYLKGRRVKDVLDNLSEEERKKLCKKIGKNIGLLHKNDIIHGDITTSNMIIDNDLVYFIDFGLGEKTSEIESKGVDLHVLMEAIDATHSKYSNCFNYVLEGYKEIMKNDAKIVNKKIDEIVKRGRYR